MPDWQIKMNPTSPFFNPTPRRAMAGDNVYWTNNTDQAHLPWPLQPDGKPSPTGFGIAQVPPGESSDPVSVPGTDTEYYCHIHPQSGRERGSIQILTQPPTE